MYNNILPEPPDVRIETHALTTMDFPFLFKQSATFRKSGVGVHENLELLYFLGGEGIALYDDARYPVRKGDMVVVNSHAIHQVVAEERMALFCHLISAEEKHLSFIFNHSNNS